MARIKITENDLKQIIRESVENEMFGNAQGQPTQQKQPAEGQLDYYNVMGQLKKHESWLNQIIAILMKNKLM